MPQSAALMATGLSNIAWGTTPLPLDLAFLGMPGCSLRVSADATTAIAGTSGSATFTMFIPPAPVLVGMRVHQQALVLDPAAGNPAGLVVSDACTAVIGN
jgi:hypothetical protein